VYSAVVNNGPGPVSPWKCLHWPIVAHQLLKLLQQKPQQCSAIKTVESI